MTVLLALVVGFLAARALLLASVDVLAAPVLQRENFRGVHLPTAVGLLIVAAVLAVDGGRVAAGAFGAGDPAPAPARVLVLVAVLGFGCLGFVDDLLATGTDRGFRGHLRALARGRVTTGFLKLAGGGALALVLAVAAHGDTGGRPFVDAAVIALAANLANLFDRAPGRTTKYALLLYIPVGIVCGTAAAGVATAVVMGAAMGLLPGDLRERYMLGDTGANVIGAVLGLAVVLETAPETRIVVAAVLLVANLLSEVVSFSRVIERVPPLRAFDRLGRGREGDA
ncbi:MAG: hypothetical protein SGJ13_02705 [Actinomycetota bacterium]|nr:hypothetical protein [Actinomycetota bacterium]